MSTMTPIIEEDSGLVSDGMSSFSSNSRNFQRPEKDLINELNKMKEKLTEEPEGHLVNVSLNEQNLLEF